ncbi:hypothetical protein FRB96_007995 [Tulasnella sp. 330]|nr:hypothetical protein FRB96_007995 [Tulasnella sp. 330]KAG8881284.1 hypothetical protein FRB97_009697 [Tulasnella sp. 331]
MINIPNGTIPERRDYIELPAEARLWEVLEKCWVMNPSKRPSMETIAEAMANDDMFSTAPNPAERSGGSACISADTPSSSTTESK